MELREKLNPDGLSWSVGYNNLTCSDWSFVNKCLGLTTPRYAVTLIVDCDWFLLRFDFSSGVNLIDNILCSI